jgi:carbon monoxide dehydrogenase subunit G
MAGNVTEFGGEEVFAAEPARVFAALTDLDALPAQIPDLVSSEKVDDRTLKCVVRPGFSFLRGTMKLTISLSDLKPPESASMHVASQGIGVSMKIDSQLRIDPEGAGSRLHWKATITEMKGLIASVSSALVKAAADQVIRHAWQQARSRIES